MAEKQNIDGRYQLFLRLFMEHRNGLFGFILKLLPDYSVAEDILQESMMTMWEKFSTFEEGTDYLAWSKQIARYKIMSYIRKDKKHSVVHFSQEVIDDIADDDKSFAMSNNSYFEALQKCVAKLQGKSREIVWLRYAKSMKLKDIASRLDQRSSTISKHMSRVHYTLKKCIERTITAWDW